MLNGLRTVESGHVCLIVLLSGLYLVAYDLGVLVYLVFGERCPYGRRHSWSHGGLVLQLFLGLQVFFRSLEYIIKVDLVGHVRIFVTAEYYIGVVVARVLYDLVARGIIRWIGSSQLH